MKKIIFIVLIVCGLCVLKVFAASMAKPVILGTFSAWTAYMFKDSGGKVCYMSTYVSKSAPKAGRDDIFLTVTHRVQDKAYNVVSVASGYTFKKATKTTLRVDNKKPVDLMVVSDMAWGKDEKMDKQLVDLMEKGDAAYVSGQSVKGTKITDTFSLKGFGKAYDAINAACGRG